MASLIFVIFAFALRLLYLDFCKRWFTLIKGAIELSAVDHLWRISPPVSCEDTLLRVAGLSRGRTAGGGTHEAAPT